MHAYPQNIGSQLQSVVAWLTRRWQVSRQGERAQLCECAFASHGYATALNCLDMLNLDTVPAGLVCCVLYGQVFVNGTLVGGSNTLAAKVTDGSFSTLLGGPGGPSQALPPALQQAVEAAAASRAKAGSTGATGPQLAPELQQVVQELADRSRGIARASQLGDPRSDAFTGAALVDWLTQHSSNGASNAGRQTALATAEQLLQGNAITLVTQQQPAAADLVFQDDTAHWYRLRSDAPRDLPWGTALNTAYWWGPAPARPADVVAEDLRGRILALYDKYLSGDGRAVRYKALKQDPAFWEYVDATAELQKVGRSCGCNHGCWGRCLDADVTCQCSSGFNPSWWLSSLCLCVALHSAQYKAHGVWVLLAAG